MISINDGLFKAHFFSSKIFYQEKTETGFTFAPPYMFPSIVFAGDKHFVACAEDDFNTKGNCSDIRICTDENSHTTAWMNQQISGQFLERTNATLTLFLSLAEGKCNVITASIDENVISQLTDVLGYDGEITLGTKVIMKDAVSAITRDDDPVWSDFVNTVMLALFAAEKQNITKTDLFGERYQDMFINAVAAKGSIGNIISRAIVVKGDVMNNGTTGLLSFLPYGRLGNLGPGPISGGTLERVRKRKKLICGIRDGRPGFAAQEDNNFHGLDVDFCRVLASSILDGNTDAITFVSINDTSSGYSKMARMEVDVLSGFMRTIQNDVNEPTTKLGYTFSQPYFYRPMEMIKNSRYEILFVFYLSNFPRLNF